MKKVILLLVLCHVQFCVLAQNIDTLVKIRGYYVTVFSKQDVVFSFEQQIKKEKGQSYSTPIDFTLRTFFIPVQVGNKIVCKKERFVEKLLNYVQNDTIYVIPNAHNKDILKTINISTTDLVKENCILSNAMCLSPYYEISGNSDFLFNCTYIEGYARHKHIQEIKKEWQNYLWDMFGFGKKPESIEFFFIVKIENYTPYIEIAELKKWLPYLE